MKPSEIKKKANKLRKFMTGEHYYDKTYKDLKVADLLLVLEDENYHTEETILEALTTLNYEYIKEACELEIEESGDYCSDAMLEHRDMLDKKIREGR